MTYKISNKKDMCQSTIFAAHLYLKSNLDKVNFSLKNLAFTLAEVIIVIGVIGVIASLTIPSLVNKIQKHEYVVQLKKEYSMLNSGFAQMLADDGVYQLEDTSVFSSVKNNRCSITSAYTISCKPLFDNMQKYLRFSVINAPNYPIYYLDGEYLFNMYNKNVLSFDDGAVMFSISNSTEIFHAKADVVDEIRSAQIADGGGHMYSYQGRFYIDVNGFSKPNILGRDIFLFDLSGDGKLYPYYGKDTSLFDAGDLSETWQNNTRTCGTSGSSDPGDSFGTVCAARIIEEGWQMNY